MKTEEQLKGEIKKILSKKSFSHKAKDYLLKTLLHIYTIYDSPKYIKTTKEEYIEEYLTVLQIMEHCNIIHLSEINDIKKREIKVFYDSIKKQKKGNLEYLNGKYVTSTNGSYFCGITGYTDYETKSVYVLDDENLFQVYQNIHHEMTKLRLGKKLFPLNSNLPFSFSIRTMLIEGYAAVQEDYVEPSKRSITVERIEERSTMIEMKSFYHYALYGTLYKLLQLIFGVNILKQFGENDLEEIDMFSMLKETFPNIPIEYVFAHITYILNCSEKTDNKSVREAIEYYKQNKNSERKKLGVYIKEIEKKLKEQNKELNISQKRIAELAQFLNHSTDSQFQQIENKLKFMKRELKQLKEKIQNLQSSILLLNAESDMFQKEKQQIDENKYDVALESTCIKNCSLETSFKFLEQLAITRVQIEFSKMKNETMKEPILAMLSEIEQIQKQVVVSMKHYKEGVYGK